MEQTAPAALSSLLDRAVQRLQPAQVSPTIGDSYLYSGNRHETVPRALFLDNRLTPLERNTWQIFRLLLNDNGLTAFPTYEQLRPFLSCTPCGAKASHESVAKALTQLRLTRWLSLVRRRRDPNTGRMLGNVYVLHDEPLTPYEAMQLDPEYLKLVCNALEHANKGVQRVGVQVLKEISEDPSLKGKILPTRIQVLTQRLAAQGWNQRGSYPQEQVPHDSEEPAKAPLRKETASTSVSESGLKAPSDGALRHPKRFSTLSIKTIKKVRTNARTRTPAELRLPEDFGALTPAQRTGALVALQNVDSNLRQAVLDEWAARCRDQSVRSRAGYLFGIIQKAVHGEFKAWAAQPKASPATSPPPVPPAAPSKPSKPVAISGPDVIRSTVAEMHIAELKALLHIRCPADFHGPNIPRG